jgi:cholest-4-en-3-one 26-monooxygenase
MTMVAAQITERPTIDLLDPELYRSNPHELWSWMRENEPVYFDARNGLWAVTRYADVLEVERRAEIFKSSLGYRAVWANTESNMIAQDDPGHRTQRMLVQRFFSPPVMVRREPELRALVTELLDAVIDSGQTELIDSIAGQLPARLTCRLLGLPEQWWQRVKVWSEKLMRTDMRERDGHTFIEFMSANMDLFAEVQRQIVYKRANPGDDLLTVWSNAVINGEPMRDETIFHETGLFVAGGAETTRTTIAHGLRELCNHPGDWDAMGGDPSLVPGAIEEMFRWVTPLNNFFRRAMSPVTLGGQQLGMGDRVIMMYPSANRDATHFADPFRFDIRRQPNHHLSFGNGPHMCIGAPLARMTIRILLEEMTRRLRDLRVVTEPDVEANIFARAVKSFTLGYSAR